MRIDRQPVIFSPDEPSRLEAARAADQHFADCSAGCSVRRAIALAPSACRRKVPKLRMISRVEAKKA